MLYRSLCLATSGPTLDKNGIECVDGFLSLPSLLHRQNLAFSMMFSPQTHSRFWNSRIAYAGRSMATVLLLLGLLFAFDNPSWAQDVASKASSVDSLELPTDVEKQIGVGPLRQADWFKGL